jgi:hypothetical protein
VNFLVRHGFADASSWPLGKVWAEVEITQRKRNEEIAAQASLDKIVQGAVHGGKKGNTLLKETLKGLNDGST